MELRDVVVVSAVRTPMGNFGGSLRDLPVWELGKHAMSEALRRAGVRPDEMDAFALSSQQKAARAQDNGWFDEEVTPVEVPASGKKPGFRFDKDESIRRDTSLEKLGRLRAAFRKEGSVTAGNACGMSGARIVRSIHKSDGWQVEDLAEMLEATLKSHFAPVDTSPEYIGWDPLV